MHVSTYNKMNDLRNLYCLNRKAVLGKVNSIQDLYYIFFIKDAQELC